MYGGVVPPGANREASPSLGREDILSDAWNNTRTADPPGLKSAHRTGVHTRLRQASRTRVVAICVEIEQLIVDQGTGKIMPGMTVTTMVEVIDIRDGDVPALKRVSPDGECGMLKRLRGV